MATGTPQMEITQTEIKAGTPPLKTLTAKKSAGPAPAAPSDTRGVAFTITAATYSGLLLWMCFQPLAWGTYLGWVALVPFLVLVRSQARPRTVYLGAFLCGVVFFVPALSWMRVADRSMVWAWLALAAYCALYFPVALYGIRCLERWNLPLVVSVPLIWIALEYFRSFFLTGFAWYLLAHTQHDLLPMIQIADLGGVFLVSLVVAAANALLFDIAYQFPQVRRWFAQRPLEPYRTYASLEVLNRGFFAGLLIRRNLLLEGMAVAILLIGTFLYGAARLSQNRFAQGPTVCLLQSNIDQRLRDTNAGPENDDRSAEAVTKHFSALCIRASFNHVPKPDLLIWPETSFPRPWVEVSPKLPPHRVPTEWRDAEIDVRAALKNFAAKYTKIPHLLGMNANVLDESGRFRRYNSALLLNAQGRIDGKFDKMHRVPFGEYVPFKDWLPFMNHLTPYDYDFSIQQGEKFTRFKLGKHHFGVLICYEDTDPSLARRYVEHSDEEPAVDFLVNMSNDGWFDGSSEHEEHLAVSRFRAIECRRAMVRAVNMGVSALIDGNGRVLRPKEHPDTNPPVWIIPEDTSRVASLPVSQWGQFKQKAGILKATVPIDHRYSFYAATGDWLPIGAWLTLLGCAGWAYVRRRSAAAKNRHVSTIG